MEPVIVTVTCCASDNTGYTFCRAQPPEPRALQPSLRGGPLRTVQQNEASSNPASDPVQRAEQHRNRGVSEFAKVSNTCGDTDDLTAARGRWEAQRATKQTRLNSELLGPLSTKRTAQAQEGWEKFVEEGEQESRPDPGLAGERTSPSLSLAEHRPSGVCIKQGQIPAAFIREGKNKNEAHTHTLLLWFGMENPLPFILFLSYMGLLGFKSSGPLTWDIVSKSFLPPGSSDSLLMAPT